MCDVVDCAMEKFKSFDIVDISIFKLCMITFGILVGVFANKSCKKYIPLVVITFICAYAYLIYKLYSINVEEYYDDID